MNEVIACTALKDCTNRLIKTISSWQSKNFIRNIVIVDWGSKEPVHLNPEIIEQKTSKTFFIRVENNNNSEFEFSKARNTAIRFAINNILPITSHILFIDVDIFILREFPEEWFNDKIFIRGRKHKRGTILFPTSYFYKINGFNETKNFGNGGDIDFIRRLSRNGLKQHNFIFKEDAIIAHIRHKKGEGIYRKNYKDKKSWTPNWTINGKMKTVDAIVYYPDGRMEKTII